MRLLLTTLIALSLTRGVLADPPSGELATQQASLLRLDQQRAHFASERVGLEQRLDRLASEIATLKGEQPAGLNMRGDKQLDLRLVESRELSRKIDTLRAEEQKVSAALGEKARALLGAYDAALKLQRALLDASPNELERPRILKKLAGLELDRRELQSGLDRLHPEPGRAPLTELRAAKSLDPEALRAEADRLRDTRDRLLRRIRTLERRAKELRTQRELEEEMRDFQAETSLFDEAGYSSLRVSAGSASLSFGAAAKDSSSGAPLNAGLENNPNDPAASGGVDSNGSPAPGFGGAGGSTDQTPGAARDPMIGSAAGEDASGESFFHLTSTGSQSEVLGSAASLLSGDERGSPDELEARTKQMKALVERLETRASTLEGEARRLER